MLCDDYSMMINLSWILGVPQVYHISFIIYIRIYIYTHTNHIIYMYVYLYNIGIYIYTYI